MRTALYMATLSAIRHNLAIRAYYVQLKTRGKLEKVGDGEAKVWYRTVHAAKKHLDEHLRLASKAMAAHRRLISALEMSSDRVSR